MMNGKESVGASTPISCTDGGSPGPPVRVSFVMPTYIDTPGSIHLAGRAIDSVLSQTDKRCELIIVHDGKSDSCELIYEGYRPAFKKAGIGLRYIAVPYRGERGGHAACRTGMELASGEFVCLLNGDNLVYPDYVERMYQPDYDVVIGWVLMHDICGKPILTGLDVVRGYIDRLNYAIRRDIAKWARHKMHMDSDYDFLLSALEYPNVRFTNVNALIGEHH